MAFVSRLLFCFVPLAASLAGPEIPLTEFKQRRQALRSSLGESVFILFGRTEREGGDLRNGFFQESNFYYLTGWSEPGAALVITPSTEVLLIPKRDAVQERWTGPKAAPGDPNISALTGFDSVLPVESFESRLPGWLTESRNVYTVGEGPEGTALKGMLPLRELRSASAEMARLRMKKSTAEISAVEHATNVAVDAHLAAWKRIKPGLSEFQVAAAMSNVYFERGCERHAYAPIVGSGGNAATLHYSKNSRRMDAGELVLMDVGPECRMYASDITRTVPVAGKFTPRQRELYEVVLGAYKAALAAVKPGVMLGSRFNKTGLHKLAADYIESHGKDKHGNSLGKYFTHSLGHHVGLDVHDATDATMPLEAGMIITLEPGVYLPEEGIGIRIEDMVLVTENGARVLSEKLPRDIAEIEKVMSSR